MSYRPPLLAQNRRRVGSFVYRSFAIVLFGLILFPEFYHLGSQGIERWDEARHIGSAYEMLFRHDYVVNYWQGDKDYWNLKPVLSFLPIILSLKLFGKGLLAARLPSLLGFVAIVLGLYRFAARKFSRVEGLYAITLFSIWSQVLIIHSFRLADPDALYCTFYLFCILLCLRRTSLSFCLACVMAALCFLTKSWHALTLLPPLALTCVLTERSIALPFKGMLCGLPPILLWAGLRLYLDGPRFLHDAVTYDLLARSEIQIEGHHNPVSFYVTTFAQDYPDLLWQLGFLTLAIVGACWWPPLRAARFRSGIPGDLKAEMLILGVAVLSVFGMFTAAKTRLPWYTFPAYPVLCVLMTYAFALLRPALKTVACGLAAGFFVLSFSTSWQRAKAVMPPTFYAQLRSAASLPMTHVQVDGQIPQDDYAALLTYLPTPPNALHFGPDEHTPHTLVIRDKDAGACNGCALISKGDQYNLFYRG